MKKLTIILINKTEKYFDNIIQFQITKDYITITHDIGGKNPINDKILILEIDSIIITK